MPQVRGPFEPGVPPLTARAIPWITVMAGSLVTILPIVSTFPVLPPFGLLMLLAWRLLRPETFRVWAPLPLGLLDDLVSGQPLGSAMLLWTLCFIGIDLIDQRLMFRDFWQDWLIGSASIAFCLIVGRLVATPISAHVDTLLLVQIGVSVMLFPLAERFAAVFVRTRGGKAGPA